MSGRPLSRHLARGALGFGLLVGGALLLTTSWPVALAALALGLVALRGCPTCWAARLVELLARGRLERRCEDGTCTLVAPGTAGKH
ncbi:hypothetical protein ACWGB8_18135 [Kitasatospora sp. NPDC054939]